MPKTALETAIEKATGKSVEELRNTPVCCLGGGHTPCCNKPQRNISQTKGNKHNGIG